MGGLKWLTKLLTNVLIAVFAKQNVLLKQSVKKMTKDLLIRMYAHHAVFAQMLAQLMQFLLTNLFRLITFMSCSVFQSSFFLHGCKNTGRPWRDICPVSPNGCKYTGRAGTPVSGTGVPDKPCVKHGGKTPAPAALAQITCPF